MRWRALLPWGAALAVGCALLQPRFETVTPEFGYVDGCDEVVLQGSNIGVDATVTIGGEEMLAIAPAEEDTNFPEWAQDIGFKYTGITPPAPGLEPGFYDVVMTIPPEDGKGEPTVSSVYKGYYYRSCPESVHIDAVDLTHPIAPGESITVHGCNLDPEQVTARLVNNDGVEVVALPMTSECSTATVSLTVPATATRGLYWLTFTHTDGTVLGSVCGGWQDTAGLLTDTDPLPPADSDSGGADTGAPCSGTWAVVIGGGA